MAKAILDSPLGGMVWVVVLVLYRVSVAEDMHQEQQIYFLVLCQPKHN
jgi:hypothetical protein